MMEVLTRDSRFAERLNEMLKIQEVGRKADVKLALKNKEARNRIYQEFCIVGEGFSRFMFFSV